MKPKPARCPPGAHAPALTASFKAGVREPAHRVGRATAAAMPRTTSRRAPTSRQERPRTSRPQRRRRRSQPRPNGVYGGICPAASTTRSATLDAAADLHAVRRKSLSNPTRSQRGCWNGWRWFAESTLVSRPMPASWQARSVRRAELEHPGHPQTTGTRHAQSMGTTGCARPVGSRLAVAPRLPRPASRRRDEPRRPTGPNAKRCERR